MPEPTIVLLTGECQVGKSTLCRHLVPLLTAAGLPVSGLLTSRTGPHDLAVTELDSDRSYPLTLPFEGTAGIALPHFRMDPQAMATSLQALEASFPTQVFFLDEIGPLELIMEQGWVKVLELLKQETYRVAFIVVRPELLIQAIWRLPVSAYVVVRVTVENRDTLPATLLELAQRAVAGGLAYRTER